MAGEEPADPGRRAGHDAPEVRARRAWPLLPVEYGTSCAAGSKPKIQRPCSSLIVRRGPTVDAPPVAQTVSVTAPPVARPDQTRDVASKVRRRPAVDGDDPVPGLQAGRGRRSAALDRGHLSPRRAATGRRSRRRRRRGSTNATRTFASGPAAMTATRFHVGGAPVRVRRRALLHVAERPLGRAPRAGREVGGARPRARARSRRAARRRSPRPRGRAGPRRRPARGSAALASAGSMNALQVARGRPVHARDAGRGRRAGSSRSRTRCPLRLTFTSAGGKPM